MHVLELEVETEPEGAKWRFYPVGDLHIDKKSFREDRLKRYLEIIANDPHAVYGLVGDYTDGTTPEHRFYDPSTMRTEIVENMDDYQSILLDSAERLLAPLKEKPGFLMRGNHDVRGGLRWSGWTRVLADRIGARYGGDEALVRVRTTRGNSKDVRMWVIHAHHGAGGGMYPGGKINRLQNTVVHIADADIYVRGHVHDSIPRILNRSRVSLKSPEPRLQTRPIAFITAGAFASGKVLKVEDYADRKALPPTDEGIFYLEVVNGHTSGDQARMTRHETPF